MILHRKFIVRTLIERTNVTNTMDKYYMNYM